MIKDKQIVALTYDLSVGEEHVESATVEQPFVYCSGIGMTIKAFEEALKDKNEDEEFDFTLPYAVAYGAYDPEGRMELDVKLFQQDGKMPDFVCEGNVVPMMTGDGRRFNVQIVHVGAEKVTIDMNHPLAGKDLHFKGRIMSVRDASEEELKQFTQPHSCGGGCGGCGGGSCGGDCGSGCGDCNCG